MYEHERLFTKRRAPSRHRRDQEQHGDEPASFSDLCRAFQGVGAGLGRGTGARRVAKKLYKKKESKVGGAAGGRGRGREGTRFGFQKSPSCQAAWLRRAAAVQPSHCTAEGPACRGGRADWSASPDPAVLAVGKGSPQLLGLQHQREREMRCSAAAPACTFKLKHYHRKGEAVRPAGNCLQSAPRVLNVKNVVGRIKTKNQASKQKNTHVKKKEG